MTIAVRKTRVSLHDGGPSKDPLKHLNTIVLLSSDVFEGVFSWPLMMPRESSLSDIYV